MLQQAQKGVRDVVERFIHNRRFIKSKWGMHCWVKNRKKIFVFTHYNHVLLGVDPKTKSITYQWWEKPTDLRGLQSAVLVLKENKVIKEEYTWDNITKQFVLIPNNAIHQTA